MSTILPFGLMWKTARTVPTTPPSELRMVKKAVSVKRKVPFRALNVPPIHSAPWIEKTLPAASSRTTSRGTIVTVKFVFPDALSPSWVVMAITLLESRLGCGAAVAGQARVPHASEDRG
jgi:hypothetical protein